MAVPVLLTPSISPNSETNPSFRVYVFKEDGNQTRKKIELIDYLEYYTDFLDPQTIKTGDLNWKLEYDFASAYNETKIDAQALIRLLKKLRCVIHFFVPAIVLMRHRDDPALYAIWKARTTSLFDPERYAYICAIENNRQPDFLKCLQETNPA